MLVGSVKKAMNVANNPTVGNQPRKTYYMYNSRFFKKQEETIHRKTCKKRTWFFVGLGSREVRVSRVSLV